MADDRAMIRAFMAGLVERAGGVDAAAAMIGARLGAEVSKGSISKRLAGHLDWPMVEVWALEDLLGDPCVSRWRSSKLAGVAEGQSLMRAATDLVREHGEAVSAVMELASGQGNRAIVRKEVSEALEAAKRLAAVVEAQDD